MSNTIIEPRGEELIKRYKDNYSIPADATVTEEMILHHWTLEKQLTSELIASTPENRWEVFEYGYARLYNELDWLNKLVHSSFQIDPAIRYSKWADAIGDKPLAIYEVGSGKGAMITYLSTLGHDCTGTEITRERGEKLVNTTTKVKWVITDGIHLDLFEKAGTYDLILSDQVIEHFHPDDIDLHFQTAAKILKSEGRYIFSTPHLYSGPSDVSAIFKYPVPKGMHLKEYTFGELIKVAKAAGFTKISYAYKYTDVLKKTKLYFLFRIFGCGINTQKKFMGKFNLRVFLFSEWIMSMISSVTFRKKVAVFFTKIKLFNGSIFLEVRK